MEHDHEEGIRLRKQALRPIQTKISKKDGEEMKEEEPVSPAGLFFNEPQFNMHIVAILGVKSNIDLDVFKEKLPHTLLKHPRFSSLLVVDEKRGRKFTKWVRTKVDLDKHIIVADVDSDMECADKFVEDYISKLTKTSLDKLKPMWDLHVLNVKTSNAESVLIIRIHHSLGDGISLMSLLLACSRQIDNPQTLPTLPTKKNQDKKTPAFISRFPQSFIGLWYLLQLLWNTVVDVFLFMATAFFLKDTQTPIRGPPGCQYNPRRIMFRIVSLDDLKLIKNAMNSTINDVALGVTQAGLSRYLNRRYGLLRENGNDGELTEFKTNLPKKIRLRGNLVVNIRPSPGIQALADMMEKNSEAKWGNWLGFVLFPLTVALKDDPLDYIREAKATIDRKKHSLEALCTFSLSGLLFRLLSIKSATALLLRILSGVTMAFSNVVGPSEEIGIHDHAIAFLAATTYGQPNELMVNFQSYVNKMTIVLSVDETTIYDPHQLCDDIAESLELIKDAVIEKGLVNQK